MTDTLTITKEEGRVTVLHLSGILNAATQEAFLEAASQVRANGAHFLLVDISGITMVTSAGLQAIERIYRLFT
ncbi:MAG TPA: STAS domain-containing protein, partial [Anaerolineales bacterium]|nr:STAS domain-containing protein [Anaerolineales bacterium]